MKHVLNISLGTVCAAALADAAGTDKNVPFARFYGEAVEAKPSRAGNETIMGDFRAINMATGEEFKSSVIYFPRGLHETVVMAILALKPNEAVSFAYDIWGEPDPKGKSYTIGFKDLLEAPNAKDPLRAMAAKLPDMPKFD
jgi:hypothetical protein